MLAKYLFRSLSMFFYRLRFVAFLAKCRISANKTRLIGKRENMDGFGPLQIRVRLADALADAGGVISALADAGELFADEHVEDAGAAEGGAQEHFRAAVGLHLPHMPDDGGIGAVAVRAHGGKRGIGLVGCHDAHHLALVGDLEHVVP